MPFSGSGAFTVYTPGNPVVTGTTIASTAFNSTMNDFATGLTNTITRDGQSPATANIPLGGYKITGLGSGTARTDAMSFGQAQDGAYAYLTSVSGTDTITASISTPTLAAYATGMEVRFVSAGANTGAVTLNINSIGAKAITKEGTTALAAGDIPSGAVVTAVYDGTRFQLTNIGGRASVAQATLAAIAPSSYTLGPIRTYTANDTWSKPSGLRGVRVRVQGGGGGGAGALGASAQTGLGSGGGGGGYSEKWIAAASLGATETVTVGAAGAAGAATPTGGGNGGQSSFGTHAVAAGGVGGSSLSAGTSATVGAAVGTGGAGSSGDLNCSGGPGAMAYRFSGTNGFGGNGGSAVLGGGGAGAGAGGGGNTGGNYGGGGGGGNSDSTTGRVGGAGGAGVVIVEEYF